MTSTRTGADALDAFHPAVAAWFRHAFPAPTPAQDAAWPLIRERRPVLIAAPTGSGKTLTAFLAAIDDAGARQYRRRRARLPDETLVVYVSPLKALSNDIRVNLKIPLARHRRTNCDAQGLLDRSTSAPPCAPATPRSRTATRDAQARAAYRGDHAGIAVRAADLRPAAGAMLATMRTMIVDEIHARRAAPSEAATWR